ncbi:metal-dependent hydrolase family protein [Halospeciosus flavus]|uniref:Amidohydrolase family protein n=1 Tax=Halospeciosus flavus TaxID=3032283 RepID=A0ABD5Z4Y4_9EURY|nr:amidohydrolase family protein [Halospeciosus flavus]
MLLLRNATVVDATGSRSADVAVEDGEIVAVEEDLSGPDAERERDLDGRVLAPGLVDAHVHLTLDGRADPGELQADTESTAAYRAAANLRDAVEAGVTTVRDLGAPGTVAVDAARAVEEGLVAGPRVVAAGQNVCMTGGHGHWSGREADGEAEVRKAVREQLRAGADVVKCMATGGVLTEGADIGAPELLEDELRALVETANAKGRPTAAHAHGAEGLKNAVRAGITSVEHGTFMDREAARLMAERNTYWVPTAKALHGIVEQGPDSGIPGWAVEKAEEATEAFERAWEFALDEGVTVAMGTDAGTPFNFHADAAEELELMVEYGLDPTEAVRAATVNAADLLGLDDVGRIETGYRADLVVLPENPREDVTAYQEPEFVVANGEIVA